MQSNLLTTVEQQELALVREVNVEIALETIMRQTSLLGAVSLCISASGLQDKEIYLSLEIDAGHWSRIMKGDAHFPLNKLGELMNLCGNEAPLIWFARSKGYGLVQLETETQRLLRIEQERHQKAIEENQLLRNLLVGRAAA